MLNFTVESKTLTLGTRKGQKVYYAKQMEHQRLPLSVMAERISASTSLTVSDVHAAIIALTEVIHQELSQGRSVDLGVLGHIKVNISSRMMDRPEDVTASVLRTPRVRFYPKEAMKQAAKSVLLSVQRKGLGVAGGTNSAGSSSTDDIGIPGGVPGGSPAGGF